MKKKEDKLEEIYYCFRYRCKRCPRDWVCEKKAKEKEKKGMINYDDKKMGL